MIGKLPGASCPGCGNKVKKPYLTSFRAYSEKRLYECPKCGGKFTVLHDLRSGECEIEHEQSDSGKRR